MTAQLLLRKGSTSSVFLSNEVELALDPALSIRVAVAGSENLRVPLIRHRSLLGLVRQRELLIIGQQELAAHHLEGLHKVRP